MDDFYESVEFCDDWLTSTSFLQVKGVVFKSNHNGVLIDIGAKAPAYLPMQEACIHKLKSVEEVGLFPGFEEEFAIIRDDDDNGRMILSLKKIQYDLCWERCTQILADDVVVRGTVGQSFALEFLVLSEIMSEHIPIFMFDYLGCGRFLLLWATAAALHVTVIFHEFAVNFVLSGTVLDENMFLPGLVSGF